MSRVTAPKHLTRAINSAAASVAAGARSSSTLLDNNAGAVLMPKYAELLRNRRSSEHTDSSRGMTTTHRPTPQPSIVNRSKPLMQTFHSSPASSATPVDHLDAIFLPSLDALTSSNSASFSPAVPILPDNFSGLSATEEAPVLRPGVTIIAADPDKVMSNSALSEVNGLDGIVLGFAHEGEAEAASEDHSHQGGMVKDLWKGMVEDVFGSTKKTT